MTKASALKIPDTFSSENEEHKYLNRFKKSWEKRFRTTRMEELFEAVDIGNYLIALNRSNDAIEFLEYITSLVKPTDNQNIWGPVGYAHTLLCYLYRKIEDSARSLEHLNIVKTNSFVNCENFTYLDSFISEHSENISNAKTETQKWGCQILSRHLIGLIFLRETNDRDFPHSGRYNTEEMDSLVDEAFAELRVKLK